MNQKFHQKCKFLKFYSYFCHAIQMFHLLASVALQLNEISARQFIVTFVLSAHRMTR